MDEKTVWSEVLKIIKNMTDDSVGFKIYIEPAVPVEMDDYNFTVSVNLPLIKSMIERRYKTYIEAAIEKITNRKYNLIIKIDDNDENSVNNNSSAEKKEDVKVPVNNNNSINPNYTFENFVIGESNKITTAYAIRVAEKPGYVYNPLFLYGNSGLGKTHLMYAIGNRILQTNPGTNVIYTTTESFTNEFVDSIKTNTTMEFKRKYRSADVFLIDDIQFIEDKTASQEEFFHTFNTLYSSNKQIVITSDRKPNDLVTIEERLRTRFSQGLTADLSFPDFETRVAILQKKADLQNKNLPRNVLEYIAKRINSNVRELEGALTKIISMSQISKREITTEYAEEIIKSIIPEDGIVKITPDRIIEKVSSFYNISVEDLTGHIKTREFAFPRQVAMYLCYKLTDMRYGIIGKSFGNKDRTTVMHNVKKIEDAIKTNPTLKSNVNYIIKDLQSV